MRERRQDHGWSFKRFFFRIFLPFLFVALVAVGMRIYLTYEFNERHVRMEEDDKFGSVSPEMKDRIEDEDRSRDFSEENRATAVAGLRSAKSVIDKSLEERIEAGEPEDGLVEEARAKQEALRKSIESLDTADRVEWERARKQAYQQLDDYGEIVGRLESLS